MSIQDGLPTPTRYYAMAVVILCITMSVLDGTIVNLALPVITRDLQSSAAHSIWIVNAYQICTLALLLPCATLGDVIGYRRVQLSGLVLFTLASLACALADSLTTLTIARAFQGLGAAGIMSVNPALVRLIYPRRLLGRGIAINSVTVASAAVAGPSIAAGILSVASWPWLFAVNLPVGILVFGLGLYALPKTGRLDQGFRLPWFDIVLNVLMFGLIFLGVQAVGVHHDATSGSSGWWLVLAGAAVGVVYLRRQLRQALPVFPVDLLRIPVFALSMCTSVAAFSAQTLTYIALPFLLLDVYGHTQAQAGLLVTAWPLAVVVVAPLAGYLIGRCPDGALGGIGLAILATGLALLATLPASPSDLQIAWRLALCGMGFGLFQSPNNHTIMTSAPLHRSGGASGMLGAARLSGQTLGALITAIVFSLSGVHDGHGPIVALSIAAGLSAVAGLFSSLRLRYAPA